MTTKLEQLSDFPMDAFRALLQAKPEQREFIRLYMECSDVVQSVVRSMFAVLESPSVTEDDRQRAFATIADALYLNPLEGHGNYGMDLARIERETALKHPEEQRRPQIANRLDQLDSQETVFADRLREILDRKNIKQEELAERVGCTQSAISKMLTRNCRPQKKTIFKLADALNVEPTDLWPDLEVAAILDTVASFQQDQELTEAQATALDAASKRSPAKVKAKRLPSRKGK